MVNSIFVLSLRSFWVFFVRNLRVIFLVFLLFRRWSISFVIFLCMFLLGIFFDSLVMNLSVFLMFFGFFDFRRVFRREVKNLEVFGYRVWIFVRVFVVVFFVQVFFDLRNFLRIGRILQVFVGVRWDVNFEMIQRVFIFFVQFLFFSIERIFFMIVGFSLVIFVIIFVFLVLSSFLMLLIEYWEILRVLVMFLFLMVFLVMLVVFLSFFMIWDVRRLSLMLL